LLECGGCGIYSSRPKVCNDWYCAWRNMAHLDDDWRPDRMGVMLEFSQDNFPGEYAGKVGFRLTILDKTKIKSNAKLANFVGTQIHNKVPCIISYGTMVAELPTAGFLNYALAKAVGLRSEEGILYGITKAIEACEAQPKEMVKIVNGRLAPAED
jgi:hypothetical protein